jgi:hypothetical protein
MSKREAYSLETLLKLKHLNPGIVFEGEDKLVWDDFINGQKNDTTLNNIKKSVKIKQTLEKTDTDSFTVSSFKSNKNETNKRKRKKA